MISGEQWGIYQAVLREARKRNLPFMLGGGFAWSIYTGNWRNTKDMDLFVLPGDRQQFIDLVTGCGLQDYYVKLPYDRRWIYRSYRGDTIVDVIWAMANQRAEVDAVWLERAPRLDFQGERVCVIPAEEMIWDKLYIVQRERCDWPDVINLLYATGPKLDWNHLIKRMDEDLPLLKGVLSVFCWLASSRALEFPKWIWDALSLPAPRFESADMERFRADLLDSRPWLMPERAKEAA